MPDAATADGQGTSDPSPRCTPQGPPGEDAQELDLLRQTVAADFDVLGEMLTAAHAAGLPVYANMSTFGEGHKYVHRGLAYTHPDWQTTLYEVDRGVSAGGGPACSTGVSE